MATAPPTPAQAELIRSLTMDEIPIKLRCAVCSKLAVNAFRLPCCDQAICETCQSTLPPSCPVCEHSPVAAADCKPNKALRTTIKVFLRTEEKKREAQRVKEQKEETLIAPVEQIAATPVVEDVAAIIPEERRADDPAIIADGLEQDIILEQTISPADVHVDIPPEEEKDVPQKSIEEIAPGQEEVVDSTEIDNAGEDAGEPGNTVQSAEPENPDGNHGATQSSQTPGFGMGSGFDAFNGGFPNMAMMGGGDFNQMQMMMAMQNGMGAGFGGFPMGMPGMSMDPMAMQNMYMNGGFGGGMNGLSMGMGMGGFDGSAGFNNGWNGQQSWNIAQDNFKNPNASGMGPGDFGANNSGFNRYNSTGFNQGNTGRQNQYNDFQQNSYGFRGRGRGRGYGFVSGRGGYNQNGSLYGQQNFQEMNGQATNSTQGEASENQASDPNVDEFGREIRGLSQVNGAAEKTEDGTQNQEVIAAPQESGEGSEKKSPSGTDVQPVAEDEYGAPQAIQTFHDSVLPSGFSKAGFAAPVDNRWGMQSQMGFQGHGFMNHSQSIQNVVQVPDVPIDAPKGPKAMREGLPNVSSYFLRGRGGYPNTGNRSAEVKTNGSFSEGNPIPAKEISRSPERDLENQDEYDHRDRSRSRSSSRSEQHDREESRERRKERRRERRRHRHRSRSGSEDDHDDNRRDRRRRHSTKYEDELDRENEEEADTRDAMEGRSRSQSPTESRRSSHRTRHHESRSDRHHDREREKEKDRGKDKDRDRDSEREHKSSSSTKHRSSHRSHKDRSRSPHRSSRSHHDRDEKDRDKDRNRRHRRHRDESTDSRRERRSERDRERESRRSKVDAGLDSVPETPVEPVAPKVELPLDIPKGPRAMSSSTAAIPKGPMMGIKGAHARHQVVVQDDQSRERSGNSNPLASRSSRDEDREKRERDRASRHSRDEGRLTSTADVKTERVDRVVEKKIVDPHELEREKRNRDRLMKEAQRMAGLAGLMGGAAGRKRSRDDVGTGDRGKKRREVEG